MPELEFHITGVETATRGLTPVFLFKLQIDVSPPTDRILGLLLNVQVQLQCPHRGYTQAEQAKLVELFGPPDQWGNTLRNRLWTITNATVGAFAGRAETILPVQCTYDLNIATTKYFYALESGDVSLLFLFSGSVFYLGAGDRLQVEPISWNSECVHRFSVESWRQLMQRHYPNSAWLTLQRDVFDRLYAFKRDQGLATWEEAVERLLSGGEKNAAPASAPIKGAGVADALEVPA